MPPSNKIFATLMISLFVMCKTHASGSFGKTAILAGIETQPFYLHPWFLIALLLITGILFMRCLPENQNTIRI